MLFFFAPCGNPQKSSFFLTELKFLGHRISREGIKVYFSKAKKILNWPMPKTATKMWQFLGLVQYLAVFLPNLAEQMCILTPLTTKECKKISHLGRRTCNMLSM